MVPPPVDVKRFFVREGHEGYYVLVSRLMPYKRIDLAIEACERLGRRLKIAGVGPEEKELRKKAGKYTEFLGFVPDADLPALYAGARALLFPQEEDFGITPLEAAAAGKPTIAYRAGGALETIIDGTTGLFFDTQDADNLMRCMEMGEKLYWHGPTIRAHAQAYGREVFLRRISDLVHDQWNAFKRQKVRKY